MAAMTLAAVVAAMDEPIEVLAFTFFAAAAASACALARSSAMRFLSASSSYFDIADYSVSSRSLVAKSASF